MRRNNIDQCKIEVTIIWENGKSYRKVYDCKINENVEVGFPSDFLPWYFGSFKNMSDFIKKCKKEVQENWKEEQKIALDILETCEIERSQ